MTLRLLTVFLLAGASACAAGEAIPINGAGATFPAPLYARWIDTYNQIHPESHIDYQPIGSGGGLVSIANKAVQFAGSDAPMADEQIVFTPGIVHLPSVAGAVVLIYHHPMLNVTLTLDGPTLAGIFLGEITKWNDKSIAATNPGVILPSDDIIVVHRSETSGTSWIFTDYLTKVSPTWAKQVGNATSVTWPTGIGSKGNAGVADVVGNTNGAIGYVELVYATAAKLSYAKLVNHAGQAVEATTEGVFAAAINSPPPPPDLRVSITDAPGAESYPICGFTYLLVYKDLSYLKNPEQAKAIAQFLAWCESDGQAMAAPAYARLPEDIRKSVIDKLCALTVDGKPALSERFSPK